MPEIPLFELGRVDSGLRPDELQFIAAALDDVGPRLGADAQPVEAGHGGQSAVRFRRDSETAVVERVNQRRTITLGHKASIMPTSDGLFLRTAREHSDDRGEVDFEDMLNHATDLVEAGTVVHRYPTCWRCGSELVFRLVDEWFISMDQANLRADALRVAAVTMPNGAVHVTGVN